MFPYDIKFSVIGLMLTVLVSNAVALFSLPLTYSNLFNYFFKKLSILKIIISKQNSSLLLQLKDLLAWLFSKRW